MTYRRAAVGLVSGLILIGASSVQAQFHGHGHGHGQSAYPKLNYDSLFDAATPVTDEPAAVHVIRECMAAYGGREQLMKLSAFRATWNMDSPLYQETVPVVRSYGPGRKHRIEVQRPGQTEIRILNGEEAWLSSHDTVLALEGMRYKAEVFSHLALGLPLSLENEPYTERRWGRRTDDSLHYVYLKKKDSLVLVVGINPGNHLISLVEGVIVHGEQRMVFVNRLGKHRTIDGYLFPHELINISMGMKVGISELRTVDVNPDFLDDEFEEPLQLNMSRTH